MREISLEEYNHFKMILHKLTGIHLGPDKRTFVQSRLFKRMSELQLHNFTEYSHLLSEDESEQRIFVNCMTTNKTDWFREMDHFDFLKKIIDPHKYNEKNPLTVWSAASSTGEEAYSLAMLLSELSLPYTAFQFRILATDIDTEVLKHGAAGQFASDILSQQVPADLRQKYFKPSKDLGRGGKSLMALRPEIISKVKFRPFNLIQSNLPAQIHFDIIFLRNVLIYFEQDTIQYVITRLSKYLKSGGHLFIGHAESLNGISHPLKAVSDAVYKKAA